MIGLGDHPEVRRAIEKDRADITHVVRRLLISDASERQILGLRAEEAERFMEVLSTVVSFSSQCATRRLTRCHAVKGQIHQR